MISTNGVHIGWIGTDKTILCHTYYDGCKPESLNYGFSYTYDLLNTLDHPVYVIFDVSQVTQAPPQLLQTDPEIFSQRSANERITIFVGTNLCMEMMRRLLRERGTASVERIAIVDNIEDAYVLIAEESAEQDYS